jgi:hypothetical protein
MPHLRQWDNARTVSIYENSEAGVRRASTSMKLTLQSMRRDPRLRAVEVRLIRPP